jgi:PAS domain S-box-containing protein
VEVEYRRKDGSTFVGLLSTRRVDGHNGEETYFDGAITDITEQKQQREELREAKSRYQTLVESFPEGAVFLFDEDLTYQLAGGEGLADVGLTSDEVIGRTIHDLFPAAIAERQARYYRRALEGETHRFEAQYQGRHYRVQVLPVRGDDGEIVSGMAVSYDITDRKRRQMALRDRQEKIEALYSAADHVLRASTPEAVGEALTRLVREALGYPGVSVRFAREGRLEVAHVADTTFEFMPERPDFAIDGDSAVAEVYRSGDTLVIEDLAEASVEDPHDYGDLSAVVVVPLGEHGTFSVASPEPGVIGAFDSHLIEVLGTYATAVLDRLDRETRLQNERDLLDRLLATSPAAIVLLDDEGAFVRANDQAKEVLGLEKDEITSRTFSDPEWGVRAVDGSPIPPEELPFARVIRTGEPIYGYEHAIEWPDGARRILSVSGAPLEGAEGEMQGALFHLNDVTERKARKQDLRERKQKIEALYKATGRLLRAKSREAVSARMHEVVRDVFAYPFGHTTFLEGDAFVPERTLAPDHLRVPAPEPRPAGGDTVIDRTLQTGEATVVESTEELNNDLDYGDLRSAAGVPIGERGVLVVGTDAEGAFDRLNLRLLEVLGGYAALVLDRLERERDLREAKEAAEAARVDAEQARDEARKASQVKSAFLANMSHEIRTPLTSIIGFAEALGEEFDGSQSGAEQNGAAGRFAELIEQGGRRLLQTLNGVLNLSKLEAGQMDLTTTEINLTEKALQAAEEFRPKAEEKGLWLKTADCEADVWTQADDGAVQIVLQNLVSNAIKYTEEGGVHLRTYSENDHAVLEVEDSGIGMDPAVAEDLFEPFRQASEGIGREYEGSGVGLAVTRKAVEKMDGRITVETEKGEGSCFIVRLPKCPRGTDG